MTEETAKSTTNQDKKTNVTIEKVATPPPKKSGKKRGKGFFILFLLLLLSAAIGLSYYLWQQHQALLNQIPTLTDQITDLKSQIQTAQSSDEKITQALQPVEKRLHELAVQQQNLASQQNNIAYRLQQSVNNPDWILAEVAYLFTLANHRLVLTKDAQGALTVLQAADERLQTLSNPALLNVKEQLAKAIADLQALELVQIEMLSLRLAHHAAHADQLALFQGQQKAVAQKTEEVVPVAQEKADWQMMAAHVWQELKKLVTVRYNPEAEKSLLSQAQRQIVKDTLRLKLETSRLFLLQQDSKNFTATIRAVRDWLHHYYDQNDENVQMLQTHLAKMQSLNLTPELPDISYLMNALQNLSGMEDYLTESAP